VSFVKTYGKGVHRFDLDENYAYISTEMEGFVGNILVIYDIRHPSRPVEVSRWWMHGQNVGGGEPTHPKALEHRLHHAMRCGDQMFAGCWASGVAIIDVSDINHPRTLSHYQYEPPRPEPTHTFLKVPFPINGKTIAVSTEEERPQRGPDADKPHAAFRTWDVTDPTKPQLLHQRSLPAPGEGLHHPEAERRAEGAAHQRRRQGRPRPHLLHRQGARLGRDRIPGVSVPGFHDLSSPRKRRPIFQRLRCMAQWVPAFAGTTVVLLVALQTSPGWAQTNADF
jgi:LVIVD repeat